MPSILIIRPVHIVVDELYKKSVFILFLSFDAASR